MAAAERHIRVKALAEARRKAEKPPSWNAIIVKSLALAFRERPEFRRCYMPYPWPHLYESPESVASIVIDREYLGEPATFLCPMVRPDERSLHEIGRKVQQWKNDPVESHVALRRLVRNAKPPWPIRRMLWAIGLYASGRLRARTFGTYAVNSLAGWRGRMLSFQSPLSSTWYYGIVESNGTMLLQIAGDHRVFDGVHTGKAIGVLEAILNGPMIEEVMRPEAD